MFNKSKERSDWTKIHAYSTKKELDAEYKEKGENMLHELRKQPEFDNAFPEQVGSFQS